MLCQIWTAILVEIFHPGSPKLNLGQEDSRQSEGGRIRERKESNSERERERG